MTDTTQQPEHRLTHAQMDSPQGPRLTPACVCGWYSPDGSHWRFEKHLAAAGRSVSGGET